MIVELRVNTERILVNKNKMKEDHFLKSFPSAPSAMPVVILGPLTSLAARNREETGLRRSVSCIGIGEEQKIDI